MNTTTYTLQLVPKGYKVVPEEPDGPMTDAAFFTKNEGFEYQYQAMIEPPHHSTRRQCCGGRRLEQVASYMQAIRFWRQYQRTVKGGLLWRGGTAKQCASVEEARRAAEKALGFPDGLIVEEV